MTIIRILCVIFGYIPSSGLRVWFYRLLGATIAEGVVIGHGSYIICSDYRRVHIGRYSEIGSRIYIKVSDLRLGEFVGMSHDIIVAGYGQLIVGDHSYISPGIYIDTTGNVTIENRVITSAFGAIYTHNYSKAWFHEGKTFSLHPVTIGEGCWFAPHTVISNVTIGKYCCSSPNTTIVEDIPDYGVVVGSPGRVLSKTMPKKIKPEIFENESFIADVKKLVQSSESVFFVKDLNHDKLSEINKTDMTTFVFTFDFDELLALSPRVVIIDLASKKFYGTFSKRIVGFLKSLRQFGLCIS